MTNLFKRFFLFCSGATGSILKMNGCEVEHNKYAGIGVTIFFTATLAALSGGYAMFTVFHNGVVSSAFGLLWGLIIFNLDRFIVSSIRKRPATANASVKKKMMLKGEEFIKVLPRLLLAVFISVVITRPLELKLFEVEIEGQITKDLTKERINSEKDVDAEYSDINKLESDTESLRNRIIELQNEWSRRIMIASNELEGGGGTKRPGWGPEYKRRLAEASQAEQELNAFKDQYAPIIKANELKIDERKEEKANKITAINAEIDNSRGLLKRLEALSKLTTLDNLPLFLASGFIMLLFISLETAPILVKLFSGRGPYDDYLDAIEHQVYATQQKQISDINDQINIAVAMSKQLNADRAQAELQWSRNVLASLQNLAPQEFQDAQVEMAKKTIVRWRQNPASYAMPSATYGGQPVTSGVQNPLPVNAPVFAQTMPLSFGHNAIPVSGAAGAAAAASSSSNNGSGNNINSKVAAAGTQPPAQVTVSHGTSAPAQQTPSGAGQQKSMSATPSPVSSKPNTTTP